MDDLSHLDPLPTVQLQQPIHLTLKYSDTSCSEVIHKRSMYICNIVAYSTEAY
jgi:hypothetical protein